MTNLADWVSGLAGHVAPDEADLSPFIIEAFVQGGSSRAELFDQHGSTVGGFAPAGMILVLPVVLNAIVVAAAPLIATLDSSSVTELLGAVKNALTVAELRMRHGAFHDVRSKESTSATVPFTNNSQLLRAVTIMTEEMRSSGLPEDQSNLIAFRTLIALMESPAEASKHVQSLAKGS